MDPLRLLFFVVASIVLCNHATDGAMDWQEVVLIGSCDKEVGSFIHQDDGKTFYYLISKYEYIFSEKGCVFSHVLIQNLATRTYGGEVFVREGGIGSDHIVLEIQGYGTRRSHVHVKLYGHNPIDHRQNCTAEEVELYRSHHMAR